MCGNFYSGLNAIIYDWAMHKLRLNMISQGRNGIAVRVTQYTESDFEGRNRHGGTKNVSALSCDTCVQRRASQVAPGLKNLPANAGDVKRHRFYPWLGKIPWRRAWQPTPVFLSGKSHGQRSLMGYSQSIELHRVRHDWSDLAHTYVQRARHEGALYVGLG